MTFVKRGYVKFNNFIGGAVKKGKSQLNVRAFVKQDTIQIYT